MLLVVAEPCVFAPEQWLGSKLLIRLLPIVLPLIARGQGLDMALACWPLLAIQGSSKWVTSERRLKHKRGG